MSDSPRRHPDLFTRSEAIEYLHLDPEKNDALIDTLRDKNLLTGWKPGREYLYHRAELDALVSAGFKYLFPDSRQPKSETGPRLRPQDSSRVPLVVNRSVAQTQSPEGPQLRLPKVSTK